MNETPHDRIWRVLRRADKLAPPLDTARAELGFETRVMATIRVRAAEEQSPWFVWGRLLWRAVPATAALAMLAGAAAMYLFGGNGDDFTLLSDPLGYDTTMTVLLGGAL